MCSLFSVLDQKYHVFGKIGQKTQNCLLNLNLLSAQLISWIISISLYWVHAASRLNYITIMMSLLPFLSSSTIATCSENELLYNCTKAIKKICSGLPSLVSMQAYCKKLTKNFLEELHFERGFLLDCSQPAFTWSKLTIEALEQGVKYVSHFVLLLILLTLNI